MRRRVKGLDKVLQVFGTERYLDIGLYRSTRGNLARGITIRRRVTCRKIILMKVGQFLKKGSEIRDLQGESFEKFIL